MLGLRTYWGTHDAAPQSTVPIWLKMRYPSPFTIALDIFVDAKILTHLSNDLALNYKLVKAPRVTDYKEPKSGMAANLKQPKRCLRQNTV